MSAEADLLDPALLRRAAEEAEPALDGGPFTLAVPPTASRADWRRLLGGTALSINDVAAAAFVPRRLVTGEGRSVATDELPGWLGGELGRTVLIVADAGEGKTTYLNVLAVQMAEHFITLRWRFPDPYDRERLARFHESVRERLQLRLGEQLGPLDPPLLVLGDADTGLDAGTADLLSSSFALRESEPDAAVVVLAGRPGQLQTLRRRLDAEIVGLAPLDRREAQELCGLVRRAHTALSATMTEDGIARRYPNLLAFLGWSEDAQADLLSQTDAQLLAALLQAVYGRHFYDRLIDEYKRFLPSPADQKAYLHVCLATAAGAPLPVDLLTALAPTAHVDERAQNDPWILDDDGMHSARHATIAQVVLEEAGVYARLTECLRDWLRLFLVDDDAAPVFERILYQAGHWEPIAPERTRQFKGELRARVRAVLRGADGFHERVLALWGRDVHRLIRWGAILRAFIPSADPTSSHLSLIDANLALLEQARLLLPADDVNMRHRVGYYLDKARRDRIRVLGAEPLEDVESRMLRWAGYIGEPWCGPDFYTDVFWDAVTMAEALTVGGIAEQDEERVVEAFRTAAISFEWLRALIGGLDRTDQRAIKYTMLMNRYIYQALPTARLRICREAWRLSARLGEPNSLLGVIYADLLSGPDGAGEADVAEARTVLLAVLAAEPTRVDALLDLALLSRGDPEARVEARSYLRDALDLELEGNGLALAHHAAAILTDGRDDAVAHLRVAIDAYAGNVTNARLWESLGERWKAACSELARLGAGPASGCMGTLRQARSKWDHRP
jgi:hypothetical protein